MNKIVTTIGILNILVQVHQQYPINTILYTQTIQVLNTW